ncbi:MAG: DUF2235 domain-containing protein [Magnetococcales bacterium]|nr:DUF2235 domain-containing protein [Magnetococcales bacterium]MBF0113991.1 DUF2235 domain-containing protein [Magnetococcales bacterium]
MSKNLIVCSDGTGNKGGYGADTNVFKLYQALDLSSNSQQKAIYDHGVGTSSNPIKRMLGGAIGLGFKQNVLDGYNFLCRHYTPGDRIFLFGFSRGAATVRALAYLIQTSGLINCQAKLDQPINELLAEAYQIYLNCQDKPNADALRRWRENPSIYRFDNGAHKIHFMGIWDTVSALGFPEHMGQGMGALFNLFNNLLRKIGWIKHRYQADLAVRQVCHALAIDDNRVAFMPRIWHEHPDQNHAIPNLEQVWFAGAHSNVGGGYPRTGLSNVALYWMMRWAVVHGLKLDATALAEADDKANADDKLYDPRDGMAALFRYSARDVEELCYGSAEQSKKARIAFGTVKIHETVIKRMHDDILQNDGDAFGYAPGFLPAQFKIVRDAPATEPTPSTYQDWSVHSPQEMGKLRSLLLQVEEKRRLLFFFFGWLLGFLGLLAWSVWQNNPTAQNLNNQDACEWPWSVLHHAAETIAYYLPSVLKPFIHFVIAAHPGLLLGLLVIAAVLFRLRQSLRTEAAQLSVQIRQQILAGQERAPDNSQRLQPTRQSWFDHTFGQRLRTIRGIAGWTFFAVAVLWSFGNILFALTIHEPLHGNDQTQLQAPEQKTEVSVAPKKYWNTSKVLLEQGKRYRIELDPDALWLDAKTEANAWGWLNWKSANPIFTISSHLWARAPEHPLFRLMGAIKGSHCQSSGKTYCEPHIFPLVPCADDYQDNQNVTSFIFTAPTTGELTTFANDLPFMYCNNGDTPLRFKIQRLP